MQINLNGSKVSVIGLGKSGLSACRLLKEKGASVFASDNSPLDKKNLGELKALGIEVETGGHTQKCLKDKDFIIRSPGVSLNSFPLNEAIKRGIPVYSEIELGFWFIRAPIIAVTGTNGKTTTVTLLSEMLKAIGKRVSLCGNIGLPLCEVAMEEEESDIIVIEVSSFQLETIRDFRPRVSVLLNITPNHLDQYSGNISDYTLAKSNLFKNQGQGDFAILNADDERVKEIPIPPGVKKIYFSVKGNKHGAQLQIQNGMLISYLNGKEEKLLSSLEIKLPGAHNLANVLAGCGAVSCLFPKEKPWLNVLPRFRTLPHRLEVIRKINGITFINDSKSTSVDSALKALQSILGPVILIAGGRDKGSSYEGLRDIISYKVGRLILFGEAKDKMAAVLKDAARVITVDTLEEAVSSALKEAAPGDYILLSPACSSFDMFRNFEERGDKFKQIIMSLRECNTNCLVLHATKQSHGNN